MTFFVAFAIGLLAHFALGLSVSTIPFYEHVLYMLLAVGLYGSVYGIDLGEFKTHRKMIISAVTFGVVLKGLLIGAVLWLILKTPFAFLLGMVVAQIDPLSVSYLVDKKSAQFSSGGKTILRAWSSFDDPMTVLFALYLFLPIALGGVFDFGTYGTYLAYNILFAGGFYAVHRFFSQKVLLALAFAIAIPFQLMLGIALCGLFLRPKLDRLPRVIDVTFILAAFILGSLVSFQPSLMLIGVVLGVAAFVSQGVAACIVTRGLSRIDTYFLAIAQYNGITSAILALILGIIFPETVVIVATAIVVINALHYVSNYLLERVLGKENPLEIQGA